MVFPTLDKVLSFVSVVVFTILLSSPNLSSASVQEAIALLKWKASLQHQKSSLLTSWIFPSNFSSSSHPKTSAIPCTWSGVSCNIDGSVTRLNLTNSNVNGTLYDFPFLYLHNLTYIDLSVNGLSGTIPPQIGKLTKLIYLDLSMNQFLGIIPPQIGLLTNLQILHLFQNQLNGSIPKEIGQLKSLYELSLSTNNFDGPIPTSLGSLRNLTYLYLYENKLSGSIPSEMGNLFNLVKLDMDTNLLTGPIPSTFKNLNKLSRLHLFQNRLSHSIPPEIGNLKSLETLILYTNNLSGSIPASLGNLSSLTHLLLYDNQLSGSIPIELGKLKSLHALELSENQLSGSIHASIFGNMSNLEILFLRDNQLSGPIPQEIGNLKNLSVLVMDENKFSGFLPENICQCRKLKRFTVNNNQLTGHIIKSLRNCSSLIRVRLDENQLTGDVSKVFGLYPNLQFMDLSNNNFFGEISFRWGQCPQLTDLRMARNNVTGRIPPEFGNISRLQVLDLSSNQLSGDIPKELEKLNLLTLNLKDNQLSGGIPRELGSLDDLLYLDLSINRLSGSIPGNLEKCLQLYYLNLSYNSFSQKIPPEIYKLAHLSELDLSHNFLTGEISWQIKNLQSLEELNLSHNNLSGFLPRTFEETQSLIYVDISYNAFRGPIPKSKAFRNASIEALQGNNGLCGNITGLEPCNNGTVHFMKESHKLNLVLMIVLPLVGATLLLGAFTGLLIMSDRRKGKAPIEQNDLHAENLFSVCDFDGRVTYDEILKATNDFDASYCIGEGGYGTVYKATLASDNIVAVKKLRPLAETVDRKGFLNEVRALTEIRHRNIVKLYGFCSHARHSFLIYEYLERGSLAAILSRDEEAKNLDWPKRVNIIKGVAHAVSYMHHDCSPPIVHRDISSKNILLDPEYEAHVSDFGTAKFLNLDSSNWSTLAGTYGYVAPELAFTMKVTEKCDVYSFGVLTLEVIKGNHPSNFITSLSSSSMDQRKMLKDELDQRVLGPSTEFEDVLISIIKLAIECLNVNPQSRPTMKNVSQLLSKLTIP